MWGKEKYYRYRLKRPILNKYGQSLLIIPLKPNTPEFIIRSDSKELYCNSNKENCILEAGKYIRDDIEKYVESLDPLNHPPTIEEFMKENRLPPPSVTLFMTSILKSRKNTCVVKYSTTDRFILFRFSVWS